MKVKKLQVGDYVEVLAGTSCDIEVGEQGIIIGIEDGFGLEGREVFNIIFSARDDLWASDERKPMGNCGWLAEASDLKLLYRPRIKRED